MVGRSWDVLADGVVAVCALVEGQKAEKESGRALGGGGATMLPMNCRLVVAQRHDRLATQWDGVGENVEMGEMACQLEVGVGNIA
jgi:hypothetical protein